jgi:hypothetical protein
MLNFTADGVRVKESTQASLLSGGGSNLNTAYDTYLHLNLFTILR